jgi:hypothetical protein
VIDKAMVGLQPPREEGRIEKYYHMGQKAYKFYSYGAFALSCATNPVIMKLIAQYFSGFSILAYSTAGGIMYGSFKHLVN